MSHARRTHQSKDPIAEELPTISTIEAELAHGYVEVEVQGLSFRRLTRIYSALSREVLQRAVSGMRSLLRPTAAH